MLSVLRKVTKVLREVLSSTNNDDDISSTNSDDSLQLGSAFQHKMIAESAVGTPCHPAHIQHLTPIPMYGNNGILGLNKISMTLLLQCFLPMRVMPSDAAP